MGKGLTDIVQLSWILYDNKLKTPLNVVDRLIKIPDYVEIEESANKCSRYNKISHTGKGFAYGKFLEEFNDDLNKCCMLIGHNIDFDKRIIIEEFKRNKKFNVLSKTPVYLHYGNEYVELCNLKYKINQEP